MLIHIDKKSTKTELLKFGGRNTAKVFILLTLILFKRKYNSVSRSQ